MFLLNSRLGLFTAALSGLHPNRAPLLPKLRGHFAEFLNESSLAHLRILSSPTCVGCGTGTFHLTRGFSRQCGIRNFGTKFPSPSQLKVHGDGICLVTPLTAWTHYSSSALTLSSCVPPSFKTVKRWYRNINLFVHRLRLSASA